MQTESKKNPSKIPLVLLRYNHNQKKIKRKSKNKSVKRLRCICDNPWVFFDLSSVAVGSQSAMQQYYLPTIYIIWRWTGISLAIIRSVSLRLQNEGQKKLTDYHRCTRSLWHGFFLTFVFWFISGFHTDLQALPLAAAVIQIVVWHAAILHTYIA